MTGQYVINILIGFISAVIGWWLKIIHQSLRDLATEDRAINDKVSKIEILVAGTYMKREEADKKFEVISNKIDVNSAKLDKIEGKIERRNKN